MAHDFICAKCKNNNISFDGNVTWDFSSQCFDFTDVFGCTFCNDCEDEVKVLKVEKPLNLKPLKEKIYPSNWNS